ncbi:MAG TPA: ribose-phosphate pyrophosphokinase [Longimicrobiaceae bacterium]|nr:ribose-phosphate pyrophosphokinase [Longimicrobiaceae bacterium]
MTNGFTLLSGTANPPLAEALARALGVELGACRVRRFPDGELSVELLDSVRGRDVLVVQPTCPPVNDHLVELLAFADVCRRSSAKSVTAVVPYFGYARADKRNNLRQPITASMVASVLQAAGVDHVLTMDLHTPQLEGFFHVPVDTLTAVPALCEALRGPLPGDATVVSPDAGRVPLATEYARLLGLPLAVLHKRRASGTETEVTHLVGEVAGRTCLLIDDMISTGGTLVKSMEALRGAGARDFVIAATHGLLLEDALPRLRAAGAREVFVTDTVPHPGAADGLHVVSVAPVLAQAVRKLVPEA